MEKINAIIVDDEKHCRVSLSQMLEWYCPSVTVINDCDSVDKATALILESKPDLIFLDIEMPKKNGFDLLKQFDTIDFEIIFTTAYDEFALEAFKVNAIDYLLKPIEKSELITAVQKVSLKTNPGFNQKTLMEIHNMLKSNKNYSRVAIPTMEGVEFVDPDNIIRCQAEGNYTKIFISGAKEIFVSKTLKQIEARINSDMFIRPHASHYVNMKYVKRYIKGIGGQLEMEDGTIIPVSRHRKDALKLK